ncbi:MAG TPA: aldehyde dehydrogenase family protein [Parvibaculum sp.]|jgi:aldehyde dehydrogenase (NAD+)
MTDMRVFYIDGRWVDASARPTRTLFNPASDLPYGEVAMGTSGDVDLAVAAARRAFPAFSKTSVTERLALLGYILKAYERHYERFVAAITEEMGAPVTMSRNAQAACGTDHLRATIAALTNLAFSEPLGEKTILYREPIGVCALITPWNWPINQIACKVAPALAAGCTMVLKPSELTPLSAQLFAEVLHEAGVPAGVFNMVHGDGPTVGTAMSSHPDVDMVSFTGSTVAGVKVAINAAPGIKRVAQELGGKSANILLDDADFAAAVPQAVLACMDNSGQSCNAPTRLLVPAARHDEVLDMAAAAARSILIGDPREPETEMGPLVSKLHCEKVRGLIETGRAEGATLAAGGSERFANTDGYFVSPTVFGNVTPGMTIAQEEIFGPVLAIMPYRDEEDAIAIANGTRYGLSAYVTSADAGRAFAVGRRLQAGMVHINGAMLDAQTPFGGYRQSGNGREGGRFGIEEFTEIKAILLP